MLMEKLERRYVDLSERAFARAIGLRRPARYRPMPVSPGLRVLLGSLRRRGFWSGTVTQLQELGVLDHRFDVPGLSRALDTIADPAVATSAFEIDDPRVFPWYSCALTSRLYDTMGQIIGKPALYLGAQVKREHPTGFTGAVRQWHKDTEDEAVLKLLVYSTDVGEDHGPFEFLPLMDSTALSERLGGSADFLSDALFDRLTGGGRSVRATGPAGTALIFDGARLFHRARPPEAGPRDSVTYSFTTRQPRRVFQFQKPSPALRKAVRGLGPEMEACIPVLW